MFLCVYIQDMSLVKMIWSISAVFMGSQMFPYALRLDMEEKEQHPLIHCFKQTQVTDTQMDLHG